MKKRIKSMMPNGNTGLERVNKGLGASGLQGPEPACNQSIDQSIKQHYCWQH
jgi:hypothetical protein